MSQLTNLFTDIADAIRAKTGSSGQLVASDFPQLISGIPSVPDTTLNAILLACVNMSGYTGVQTLAALGFTEQAVPSTKWSTLSNYTTFTNAGWSIGY